MPVTIVSTAPYPVTAHADPHQRQAACSPTAPPSGPSRSPCPPPHTNVVYVNVQTRASGVFKVDIALHSPGGGLRPLQRAGRACGPRPPRWSASSCRSGRWSCWRCGGSAPRASDAATPPGRGRRRAAGRPRPTGRSGDRDRGRRAPGRARRGPAASGRGHRRHGRRHHAVPDHRGGPGHRPDRRAGRRRGFADAYNLANTTPNIVTDIVHRRGAVGHLRAGLRRPPDHPARRGGLGGHLGGGHRDRRPSWSSPRWPSSSSPRPSSTSTP